MMSKLNNPPIMVIAALHFHRPFGFLFFYFSRRWRRFRRWAMSQPGVILYQESHSRADGLLPRTWVSMTWFRDVETLRAFNHHPEHQSIIEWSKTQTKSFDVWIEEYILREPGKYQGLPGPLQEALQRAAIELERVKTNA